MQERLSGTTLCKTADLIGFAHLFGIEVDLLFQDDGAIYAWVGAHPEALQRAVDLGFARSGWLRPELEHAA